MTGELDPVRPGTATALPRETVTSPAVPSG
jgi:hypothetical protein